jgi:diaminopimelate epimerase
MTQVADYPLSVQEQTVRVTAIRMGNPNCCVFVEDFDALDWKGIGRALETHRLFPERTNVVFARVLDREALDLRFWERGVGVTLASGTCACAAAVASALTGRTGRDVAVHMPGGQIRVAWRDDGEVVLTGEAEVVYRGEWLAGYGLRAVG